MRIAVVDTGTANTASMLAALGRAGGDAYLTRDPKVWRDAWQHTINMRWNKRGASVPLMCCTARCMRVPP